ncbi:hypothetical protein [Leptolyngbya sp. FACHB-36]|uniref:hypothetical protein n=1 Tax=Leptolyngbya sp. FACHB-36 TaxID=2692808 RepID=UPI0016815535|nr:hypothetical protein [Leptolyngbya sp. FACHB-36]
MQHSYLAAVVLLSPVGATWSATAAPADIFRSRLDQIQQALPPRFAMRLPTQILLGGPADEEFIQSLRVHVFASDTSPGLTIGLYSCGEGSPFCLIGTFAVASPNDAIVQQELKQHRAAANPIQLTPRIQGYVLDGSTKRPVSMFSSIMWQQDGFIYSVSFAEPERQNMLYMAVSMATGEPIYALNPTLRSRPAETTRSDSRSR